MGATVRMVRRTAGEGGHVTYHVDFVAPDGSEQHVEFVGNMFVGPVLVVIKSDDGRSTETVIDDPRRFGEFAAEEWVHRFFEEWQKLGYPTDCFA